MTRPFVPSGLALTFALLLVVLAAPAPAFDFPPITDAEKELGEYPGASAVILFEDAEFHFRDFVTEASSRIEVTTRIKILTEEGKSQGEVQILHDRQLRLDRVEGRTVRPDGTVVQISEDDVFLDRLSETEKTFVTKIVFPQVEVGSILDYHYVFYWDTIYYLEPWLFHGRLPKIRSQIRYHKPDRMGVKFWMRETTSDKIQVDQKKTPEGHEVTGLMTHLPAFPDEPHSFPLEDIASRMLLYPDHVNYSGQRILLMEDWREVCANFEDGYEKFRRKDRSAKKLAKSLTADASGDRERAEILYRHVRDEIRTDSWDGPWVGETGADEILEAKQGSESEKALLLQVLLDAAGLDAQPVWADHRYVDGRAELSVPNPAFFDRMMVASSLDGERILLDPSDRSLAFGRLPPQFGGTNALVVHEKEPEVIPLPAAPPEASLRRAEVELELGADGRATGTGTLALHGHSAWLRLRGDDDPATAWTERLGEAHPDFEISDVQVAEDVEAARIDVSYSLRQREEAVLGDEVSLAPAGHLALEQPFPHTPAERVTPVMMLHPSRDEVSWKLTYPEGWEIDVLPASTAIEGSEGSFRADYLADPQARTITLERVFERTSQDILGKDRYQALRLLYRVASESDARTVGLYLP